MEENTKTPGTFVGAFVKNLIYLVVLFEGWVVFSYSGSALHEKFPEMFRLLLWFTISILVMIFAVRRLISKK